MKILKNKKLILVTFIVILVGGGVAYSVAKKNDSKSVQTNTGEQLNTEGNFSPPTDEDKKQADDNKSRLQEEPNNQPQPTADNKATVTPEITIAEVSGGSVEVAGYIPTIFENNGNCTFWFTRASRTITRQVLSVAEGRATYCPSVRIATTDFPEKGIWQVKITYNSNVYSGTSSERSIEIK